MNQIIINISISFAVYLLVTLSFYIIYSCTKYFLISHAVSITLGAYFVFSFSRQLGLPLVISIGLSLIGVILINAVLEIFVYKKLRERKAVSLSFLITSLGVYVILQNLVSLLWGDDTRSLFTGQIKVGHKILGAYITSVQLITLIICAVLFISIVTFLRYTRLGLKISAVSSNEELANISGINSNNIILFTMILGSAVAAITGILVASDTGMTPTMGFNLLLYGVVAMIIGGMGGSRGLLGGVLLIATAQNLAVYYISSQWMDAITYIILILFLVWKPLGFSGKQLKKVEI